MANKNNNLMRRLRREITANPKKAAVLALLLLVAVVFWVPLVLKWTGKSSDESAPTANIATENSMSSTTNMTSTSVTTTPVEGLTKTTTPHWNHVLAAIRKDARMEPHTREEGERDPFSPSASQLAAQAQAQQAPVQSPAPETTPEQAGIVLRSTIVSPQMKTALINGRAYHEEQSVLAANGRDRFTLVEIRDNGIVLSRHGQTYEIKLRTVEVANSDQ